MTENSRAESALIAAGLFVALLLTLMCAQGDLWLDEIWSLRFAEEASSFRDIFTRFHHDNNHLLNTIYLYLIEPQSHFYRYRLMSMISGTGALFIMSRLVRRQGIRAVMCIVLLSGTSYPLILYFSEARGYAPAIFCSLLAFWQLQKDRHDLPLPDLFIFNTAMVFGMLAHFSFIIIILSFCVITLAQCYRQSEPYLYRLRFFCRLYLFPLSILTVLYLSFIRDMAIGGGDEANYFATVSYATALLFGMPDSQIFRYASLVCYACVVSAGVFILVKERNKDWILYVMVLFLSPALILSITRPQVLYFRYFVVCFPFFYLLLVKVFSTLFQTGNRHYRVLICALTCFIVAGQIVRLASLVSYGRGSYREALAYVSDHTPGTVLLVGGDHDFRNGSVLSFYARFLPSQKRLEYIGQSSWARTPPEWLFSHSQNEAQQPSPVISFEGVGSFQLQRQFRSSPDSGWDWYLYRRAAQVPGSRPDI